MLSTPVQEIFDTCRAEDDLAPVSFFKKNGYYCVGNKNFNFKINALEEASRTGQSVQWEFNTAEYKNLDWRTNTNIGLKNLYRIRAQQLRNKYNYLVLAFSGGSDSYTVLKSFIDNNIKLDEVICDWPIGYTENKYCTNRNPVAENYLSEWELAIKPVLSYLSTHHPDIKITVTDSLAQLTNEDAEDTCTITQIHNYISVKRYRAICNRLQQINDMHSSVAIVLGIEKPVFHIERDIFCLTFSDQHCWFKSSIEPDYQRNVEYFYWTPDLPEILLEQGHTIYQYLKVNKAMSHNLAQTPETRSDNWNRDFIKKLIYPDWNHNTFQAAKGSSLIYNEQYSWFFDQYHDAAIQSWESSMNSRLSLINNKYLEFFPSGRFKGYTKFFTRLYPIGKL